MTLDVLGVMLTANLFSALPMDLYRRLRTATAPLPKTRSGTDLDRVAGLERVAIATRGGTLLDVGCNDGLVSTFFAGHAAAHCVGVDFYRPGIAACRAAASRWPSTTGEFHIVDLSKGSAAITDALGDRMKGFTTVAYLGVHHHLLRQMTAEEADRLVLDLGARAECFFAIRTADAHIEHIGSRLAASGWSPWYSDRSAMPRVNPLTVFARTAASA